MSSASRALPDDGTPFIILGADAVLAALPASPVQLAHACQALGFHLAAPATWGDELIAEACLDQLANYEHSTAVMCSCPLVTERLTRASSMLEPFMLTFASPPVATARYIRAAFAGEKLHITYAGSCPGAVDDAIDARISPFDLLDAFVESGITLGEQPSAFDALVPLDRRRFYSLPGGLPAHDHIERFAARSCIELSGDDVALELTQQFIEHAPALLDLALPLGCACAGVGDHALGGNPRAGLLALEPPRARQRVLDPSLPVDVTRTLAELCEPHASAAEASAPLDAQPAPDAEPPSDERGADDRIESASAEECSPSPVAWRRAPGRSLSSVPRHSGASGATVPRASLAVLQRVLARAAARDARLDAARAPARAERAVAISEQHEHDVAHAPLARSLSYGADVPRPVPPPPTRQRLRTMQEL